MKEVDEKEVIRLCNLQSFFYDDKLSCAEIVKEHIDPLSNWCLTCDDAVRLMFRKLRWWATERGIWQKTMETK